MSETLPEPLVPADVDLRGYEFMPYYGDRLRDSDLNSRATDAEYRAAHNLWWSAWKQVPAASLPDDDTVLARLADLGRDVKTWRVVRDGALRGFVKCSDGRFYHRVLGPLAVEAFEFRNKQRDRTEKARKAALLRSQSQTNNSLSQTKSDGEKGSVTDSTGQDRTGQDRKAEGHGSPVDAKHTSADPKPQPAALELEKPEAERRATLRGAMSKCLRDEGVTINPSNPFLVKWVDCGVTVNHARQAVDIARERKPKPENIPAAYLDPIVAQVMNGKPVKSAVSTPAKPREDCEWSDGRATCGMPNAKPDPRYGGRRCCPHHWEKNREGMTKNQMPDGVREALKLGGKPA